MSFLDVISCGFGAVVLFYTIISAQAGPDRIKENTDLLGRIASRLEQEVLDGYKHLAELRNALESTEDRKTARRRPVARDAGEADADARRSSRATSTTRSRGARASSGSRRTCKSLEEGTRRLKERAPPTAGVPRQIVDDKQQLVTLRVDGQARAGARGRLGEHARRDARQHHPPAQHAAGAAHPVGQVAAGGQHRRVGGGAPAATTTQFQIYAFDTAPRPVVEGSAGPLARRRAMPARSSRRCRRSGAPRRPAARACRTPSP